MNPLNPFEVYNFGISIKKTVLNFSNTFQLLPDDCILALFERLTLDDLCVFSRTCRRLQILAQQHFQRKYRGEANTEVEVEIVSNAKLRVRPFKINMKCFQKFITNIRILSYEQQDEQEDEESADKAMLLVAKFMKRKCNNNIHGIFIEGDIALDPFCKKVKKKFAQCKNSCIHRSKSKRCR